MATRIKASAMRRRVKRRGERTSYKKKVNKTLRSRKQRGRNTVRKVMKGGAETISIFISNSQGTVDSSKPAVTLTFSNVLLSKNKKLLMSVDLNQFKGDVRKLIDFLFKIDDFNRDTTHSRTNFLVGLADVPAREGVTNWAKNYVNGYCNDNDKNINFEDENNDKVRAEMEKLIDETLLPTKTCDIEIELSENKFGGITFTVKNYHRMKIGKIQKDCNHYDRIEQRENPGVRDSRGNYQVIPIPHITKYEKQYLFYPKLEFDSANPMRGEIDYFDYEAMERNDDSTVIVYGKTNQKSTFTKANSTIESLKTSLKGKTIMLDKNGEFITPKDEEQKKRSDAEAAEKARKASEEQIKYLEERSKKEAEKRIQLSESSKKKFEELKTLKGLNGDSDFVTTKEFERFKKAISDTKEFMNFLDYSKKNEGKDWPEMLEHLKTAVSTKYTKEQITEIEQSLKIFREKYCKLPLRSDGKVIEEILYNYYTYTLGSEFFYLRGYLATLSRYDSEINALLSILTTSTSD
jgi:hypothetical protein